MTATSPIVLRSLSGSVTITLDKEGVGGWCKLHLIAEGVDRLLGAGRLKYIAKQLTIFLADPAPGRRWILSLAELHTSAYGEHASRETVIEFQDADAIWFGSKLVITPTAKAEWIGARVNP